MTWLELAAQWFVNAIGEGFDPDKGGLPAWPETQKPTAPVKAKGDSSQVYEVKGETGVFGFKSHPLPNEQGARKANAKELTEREAGEILAYSQSQKLTNQELAAAVKAGIEADKTAAEIALETGYSLSTIEKYKAALSRAKDDEASD